MKEKIFVGLLVFINVFILLGCWCSKKEENSENVEQREEVKVGDKLYTKVYLQIIMVLKLIYITILITIQHIHLCLLQILIYQDKKIYS